MVDARQKKGRSIVPDWIQRGTVSLLLGAANAAMVLLEVCTHFHRGPSQPGNVLVLRTAALGDFILSIPALKRLRAAYPTAKITLLTTASTDRATLATVTSYANNGSPWLGLLPAGLIDEILVFPVAGRAASLMRESRRLLRNKVYDVSFILNEGIGLTLSGTVKKICFLRLIGVYGRIYGFRTRAYPKVFPMVQIGERRLEHHVLALMRSVEENRRVADSPVLPISFDLTLSAETQAWAKAKLDELECLPENLIVVAPGSRLEFKRWSSAGFVQVITALLVRPHVSVILVGSGPEVNTAEQVQSECLSHLGINKQLHNLGGQTTVPQLAALLRQAAVFLGNDGGTCHLAAAVGCRVVSIGNGAEIPDSVEPWANQRFTARFDVPCSPCYCFTHCPKNDNQCVSGISTQKVLKLVLTALAEKHGNGTVVP